MSSIITVRAALPPDDERPLRIKWMADFLGISDKSVRRALDREVMPSYKMGGLRVVRSRDFKAYLEKLNGEGR